MDAWCSGQHACSVDVTDIADVAKPCKRDFTSYLEAGYSCVKGTDASTTRGIVLPREIVITFVIESSERNIQKLAEKHRGSRVTSTSVWLWCRAIKDESAHVIFASKTVFFSVKSQKKGVAIPDINFIDLHLVNTQCVQVHRSYDSFRSDKNRVDFWAVREAS